MKNIIKNSAALMAMFFMSMSTSFSLLGQGTCVEPDHFISYPIVDATPGTIPAGITLLDQFIGAAAVAFTITPEPIRLFNPATKWHNGSKDKPKNPGRHYSEFSAVAGAALVLPDAEYNVFNQFQSLVLNPSEDLVEGTAAPITTLLVPSIKNVCNGDEPCPVLSGDHYLCYEFNDAFIAENTVLTQGRLEDQFQKNRSFDRLVPTKFCNPVAKTIGDITSSYNNFPTNHLVCYNMCEKWLNPAKFLSVLNQFGEQFGFVEHDDEICVPTTKLAVPIVPSVL